MTAATTIVPHIRRRRAAIGRSALRRLKSHGGVRFTIDFAKLGFPATIVS